MGALRLWSPCDHLHREEEPLAPTSSYTWCPHTCTASSLLLGGVRKASPVTSFQPAICAGGGVTR